jgi:signal transduction histidine kinase
MGRHQIALGLDRLPVSNGGRTAQVFQTGEPYRSGQVEQDPDELRGIKYGLHVRSAVAVALEVNGTRRGALQVDSAQPDHFSGEDLTFLEAVARWVGLLLYRAELVERITLEAAATARRVAADELVTILAHDLRGPLTALKGRVAMTKTRAEREGHHANQVDARAMQRAVNRLERMISDLLDTARLDQGIFALTPELVDLATLARETAALLQTPAGDITVQTPDELCVEVDPQRIRQVLENLLTNARTHSPDGAPISLDVRAETRGDGAWAIVTVRDTGPGITPDVLPTLFTRFAAGRGSKGLGLGLYLARGIAEAHGGMLTVDSTPGNGASFRLALPLPGTSSAAGSVVCG